MLCRSFTRTSLVNICALLLIQFSGATLGQGESLAQTPLPKANSQLNVPGLGPCDDSKDRTLHYNNEQPITVLVHGCHGSAARFKALSQVLAFHGQQSACFSYDDRDDLQESSRGLADAVEQLSQHLGDKPITVMGHSQGGLIARKAFVQSNDNPLPASTPVNLVTISAPLSGIASARFCAYPALRIGTLGINDLICWAISGDKWFQITYASDFIQAPGVLSSNVARYLLISSDERGTCRRRDEKGRCQEDDFVFSLEEQQLPSVEGLRPETVQLAAGHVEIVGNDGVKPVQLINALQSAGFIRHTESSYKQAFTNLLDELYAASGE